jgi:arylsulfate sulfotransferase
MVTDLLIGTIRLWLVLGLLSASSICAHAVAILSGPSFTPATNAPLAGLLELTTDEDSRVSVSLDDGTATWERRFYDYGTTHSVPLLGFKPGRTNVITVTVQDKFRNAVQAAQPLVFITGPLPAVLANSVLWTSQPQKMEPGYTLFRIENRQNINDYVAMVNYYGEVVWYSDAPTTSDVRQLENGNLFMPLNKSFVEINMLGDRVNTLVVPTNLPINLHDGVPTPHGTILYLSDASRMVTNFPTSTTNPNAPRQTTNVLYNLVVEVSATNGALLHTWSPIDVLDAARLTYLTLSIHSSLGWDNEHANAVIEDPRDDTLIVSMRNQSIVFKFYRATGQLKWILGPHENWGPEFAPYLLKPMGTPFEWQYGQHAPMFTPRGTLLIYDNGNDRAIPFAPRVQDTNNYSRAVEYAIDEEKMEVSQVWEYGRDVGERLYTDRVGNADWLPKRGNVLINFGYVNYTNGFRPSPYSPAAVMVRIKEVTYETVPEIVFDLAFFNYSNKKTDYAGCYTYRSHRVPDLYAHPAKPVADLTVRCKNGIQRLEFSGDETRTYTIEASTNLTDWQELGMAVSETVPGNYGFEDQSQDGRSRCYRVITH